VNPLVEAGEDDVETGFMARLMTLCGLSRANRGHRLHPVR